MTPLTCLFYYLLTTSSAETACLPRKCQFLWLNYRKMFKISIIRSFGSHDFFFYIKIKKLTVICGQFYQHISPDMPCDTLYNYCPHMRWISKVVNSRVVDFPKDNNLSRVGNVMFISYEGINYFIRPKLSSKRVGIKLVIMFF